MTANTEFTKLPEMMQIKNCDPTTSWNTVAMLANVTLREKTY